MDSIDLVPLDLPGRGKNMNLPLLKSFDKALTFVIEEVSKLITEKEEWILFGHSMGAYIAYELEHVVRNKPSLQILSGINFPNESIPLSILNENDENLIIDLARLGGIPNKITDLHLFTDWFAPLIRSDLEILNTYQFKHERNVVSTPTLVINSIDDPLVKRPDMNEWINHFKNLRYLQNSGDHFAVYKEYGFISKQIVDFIK